MVRKIEESGGWAGLPTRTIEENHNLITFTAPLNLPSTWCRKESRAQFKMPPLGGSLQGDSSSLTY